MSIAIGKQIPSVRVKQQGAALVVGLMLLVVLTLLAVTGMNTASTELVMAGNEQYQKRASQAAESGVEQALGALGTVSGPAAVPGAAVLPPAVPVAVPGADGDGYSVTSRYMGEGSTVPGYSSGDYAVFQFQIESTGTSVRNARARVVQGAFTIQSKSGQDFDDIPE